MRAHQIDLPDDPSIERLAEATRRAIASHWLRRAAAERSVAVAFEALRPRIRAVGAADIVLALIAKAIDDERRHGDLCVRLAERYQGEPVVSPDARDGTLPNFGTGDERLEVTLTVVGMCCVNESIASEWIRSCWRVATAPIALAANKAHLHDEIDHARLGWAHLASDAVSAVTKRELQAWTPRLLRVNVAQWKRVDDALPEEGVPAHGHLSRRDNEDVIDAAVRDVVLPGFAHVGIG
jgi:hypothetical protein